MSSKQKTENNKSTAKKDCVFCQIVAGDLPSYKIWEEEDYLAFLSIFPNTEAFSVVATKTHLPSYIFENSDEVVQKLALATKRVAKMIDGAYKDVGRTGVMYEGFGVDHLHAKLFPMHGTGEMGGWEAIESSSSRNEYYEQYPGFLSSHDSKRADDNKLEKVQAKILGKDSK